MVESGTDSVAPIGQNTVWTTILQSCDNELSGTPSTMTYNVVWRFFVKLDSTSVPIGTPYEIELATTKAGVVTVHQVLSRKILRSVTKNNPQTDYFATFVGGLSGDNGYRVRMRVLGTGGGQVDPSGIFMSIQGSPAQYGGAASSTLTSSLTLDTTWREISGVTMNNTSGGNVDVLLQSHFTVNAGVEGSRILLGFGREAGSSGNHYSHIYIPASLPGNVTVLDFMPNEGVGDTLVPAGLSTFRVWARMETGTATITNRRTEVLAMNATPGTDSIRYYQFTGGPILVTENPPAPQPQSCIQNDLDPNATGGKVCDLTGYDTAVEPKCGRWTRLLAADGAIPATPSLGDGELAAVGSGYFEVISKSCSGGGDSCWQNGPAGVDATRVQLAIELVTNDANPAGTDIHMEAMGISLALPSAAVGLQRSQVHFFSDLFHWGNFSGQKIRLWIRLLKSTAEGSCDVIGTLGPLNRQFTIGRAYLGVRFFPPTGTLYFQ